MLLSTRSRKVSIEPRRNGVDEVAQFMLVRYILQHLGATTAPPYNTRSNSSTHKLSAAPATSRLVGPSAVFEVRCDVQGKVHYKPRSHPTLWATIDAAAAVLCMANHTTRFPACQLGDRASELESSRNPTAVRIHTDSALSAEFARLLRVSQTRNESPGCSRTRLQCERSVSCLYDDEDIELAIKSIKSDSASGLPYRHDSLGGCSQSSFAPPGEA